MLDTPDIRYTTVGGSHAGTTDIHYGRLNNPDIRYGRRASSWTPLTHTMVAGRMLDTPNIGYAMVAARMLDTPVIRYGMRFSCWTPPDMHYGRWAVSPMLDIPNLKYAYTEHEKEDVIKRVNKC